MKNKVTFSENQFDIFNEPESDFYNRYVDCNKIPSTAGRYIRGNVCVTKDGLFNEVHAALQFPYYCGNNWDAFSECLNDLEWFTDKNLIIFISNIQNVLQNEEATQFTIFIRILTDAINEFSAKETVLKIVLHTTDDSQKIEGIKDIITGLAFKH